MAPEGADPLKVGAQNLSLSTELREAKLHHGLGRQTPWLQVLQSGTGEALTAEEEGVLYAPVRTGPGWEAREG